MSNVWDGVDLGLTAGDFITLRDVGEVASGVLKAVRTHDFDDGKGPKPQLTLVDDEGTERVLTAGPFQLRQLLGEKQPQVGDKVTITLVRLEPRPVGKAKIFTLDVVKAANVPAPVAGQVAAATQPPF